MTVLEEASFDTDVIEEISKCDCLELYFQPVCTVLQLHLHDGNAKLENGDKLCQIFHIKFELLTNNPSDMITFP